MVAWTGVLLGFYIFLRKSNLVPDTMMSFDKEQQFCRGDINLLGLDRAMMVEIRWSKTIQFKQKILLVPVLPAKNKVVCPVFWVHYMVQAISAKNDRPALALADGRKILTLLANQLIARLRKWLTLIEEDSMGYLLHSLCRGGQPSSTSQTWRQK